MANIINGRQKYANKYQISCKKWIDIGLKVKINAQYILVVLENFNFNKKYAEQKQKIKYKKYTPYWDKLNNKPCIKREEVK